MSRFNPIAQEYPRPHHLPGDRVLHESGVTVPKSLPPSDDSSDENDEPERAPYQPTPVFYFRTQ
jgi:hypothetical protein